MSLVQHAGSRVSSSLRRWLQQCQSEFQSITSFLGVEIQNVSVGEKNDPQWCPFCRTLLSCTPQKRISHIENCILRHVYKVTNPHEVREPVSSVWYYEQCPGVCCFQLPPPTETILPAHQSAVTPRVIQLAQQHSRLNQPLDAKLRDYECIVAAATQQRESRGGDPLNMVTEETVHRFVPAVSTTPQQKYSEDRPKSELEILAEQRDYRRRRQTYRAKNVHITKRTPTQVQRDIIFYLFKEIYGEEIAIHQYHQRQERQQTDFRSPTKTEQRERSQTGALQRNRSLEAEERTRENQSHREVDKGDDEGKHRKAEEKHRDRNRDKDREKDRDRVVGDRDKDRDRNTNRHRDRGEDRDREKHRDRDRDKERNKDRTRSKGRERYNTEEKSEEHETSQDKEYQRHEKQKEDSHSLPSVSPLSSRRRSHSPDTAREDDSDSKRNKRTRLR